MRRLATLAALTAVTAAACLAIVRGEAPADAAPVPALPPVLGTYAVGEADGDGVLIVRADGSAVWQPIAEDDPRWDCSVHGNRVCEAPIGR